MLNCILDERLNGQRTYSECVVTVNSSRRAALEARSARGETQVCRASGVFPENLAPSNSRSNPRRVGLRPAVIERRSP